MGEVMDVDRLAAAELMAKELWLHQPELSWDEAVATATEAAALLPDVTAEQLAEVLRRRVPALDADPMRAALLGGNFLRRLTRDLPGWRP